MTLKPTYDDKLKDWVMRPAPPQDKEWLASHPQPVEQMERFNALLLGSRDLTPQNIKSNISLHGILS
jgi:hypothetical protein